MTDRIPVAEGLRLAEAAQGPEVWHEGDEWEIWEAWFNEHGPAALRLLLEIDETHDDYCNGQITAVQFLARISHLLARIDAGGEG